MKVLLVKITSLGDLIHTLPAITELQAQRKDIEIDWLIEETLVELAQWHPAIANIIPVASRRWRNQWRRALSGEISTFLKQLRREDYDLVLDCQGLLKSAILARFARGLSVGYHRDSIRERWASGLYQQSYKVDRNLHAIHRNKALFAHAFGYESDPRTIDYGLDVNRLPDSALPGDYLLFLHGTAWQSKLWPDSHWRQLIAQVTDHRLRIYLPWGNLQEKARAETLAANNELVTILPKMTLAELAGIIKGARAVVAVDTGLGHLAAALARPCVSLYGSTSPNLTGTLGRRQIQLKSDFSCSPCLQRCCPRPDSSAQYTVCYKSLSSDLVFQSLLSLDTVF